MKRFILALVLLLSQISFVLGQTITDNLGIGFNIGGQRIYNDDGVLTKFAPGLETYLKYRINDRFFVY